MAEKACHVFGSATQVGLTQALEPMKKIAVIVLAFPIAACAAGISDRAARANALENQPLVQSYIYKQLYPALGSDMATAMDRCVTLPGATKDKFEVVADIAANGAFLNLAYQPESVVAECYAKALSLLRAPLLPISLGRSLPVVFDMSVK